MRRVVFYTITGGCLLVLACRNGVTRNTDSSGGNWGMGNNDEKLSLRPGKYVQWVQDKRNGLKQDTVLAAVV